MKILQCINLCKTFKQGEIEVHALKNINLQVEKGEFLCLSGPSGSGKTTLLNMIGGLDTVSSGEVIIGEQKIHQMSRGELAQMRLNSIGFIFQAYNLIPVLSALENVEFVMQIQGIKEAERRKRALALLEKVGLGGMEKRRPSELSGGQQQRVAVARAIVSKPELVLADEPTANLDSHTASQLMELFRELNREFQTTFILSTHDQMIMQFAKRLIRLKDGEIEKDMRQNNEHNAAS